MSGPSPIRHSVSMLEMNEIRDVNHLFDNADDGSLGEECHGGILGKSSANQEEEDDFLFLDTEDDDDVDDNLYKLVAAAAKSSSSNSAFNMGSGMSSGSGGMRRVQSMGAMAQGNQKFSLLASMAPDIHTIHEDGDGSEDEGDHDTTNKKGEEQMVQVNFGDDDEEDVKKQPPPESSNTRRRSSSSRGGGLRNSLNGLRNSLNGLRNSLNGLRNSLNGLRNSLNGLRNSLNSSVHGDSGRNSLNSSSHSYGLNSSQHSQPKKSCMKKSTSAVSLKRSTSNVSFGELEIRSYGMTAGDAPTPNGVPLSLDWEYDPEATQTIDVETYEASRGVRRSKQEMFVPNQYRVYLLMRDSGLSRRDIKLAIADSQRAFKNRQKTAKNLKMQPLEEAMEKTTRKFSKMKKRLSGKES